MISPFRGFRDMQSEMERMFDEAFGAFGRPPYRRATMEEWTPAVDAVTSDGELVIRAELPGLKREDVDVTVSNGILTISGERKEEREEKGSGYLLRERRYGSFRRSMTLPEGTDEGKVKARFEDGVLEVRVEGGGKELPESRRVEIEE
jgi:HSP20 family protein